MVSARPGVSAGGLGDQLRLVGVIILVRHGQRAPMYSLPSHRLSDLNCDLRHIHSSRVIDRIQAADFVAAMDALQRHGNSTTDPAWRRYGLYPSSRWCSGAQLTAAGALQMLRLGLLLRGRGYHELASRAGVVVRASRYSRTIQSAAALLYGLSGQATDLVDSARVELTRDAYLCLEQRRTPSSSLPWNLTCGCRSALDTLVLRRRHNRTLIDTDEWTLRTELASILNVTSSRLPWTATVLEVTYLLLLGVENCS